MGSEFSSMACGYPASVNSIHGKGSELLVAASSVDAPSAQSSVAPNNPLAHLQIVIGTSEMAAEDSTLVPRIVNFSDKSEREVRSRLSLGDAGSKRANRLMHVALLNGVAVGWCSSSTCGWGGDGHWGALAVDPSAQGKGVASALVKAAERRLLDAGCESVQIEYRFTVGNKAKERLYAWYEGKLGFDGGPKRSGFRCCHKLLSEEAFRAQHAKSSTLAHDRLCEEPESFARQQESKRTRSLSASSCSSSSSSYTSASPSASVQLDKLQRLD